MKLDAQQSLAVHSDSPLKAIIAGPGSGKTRTEVQAVKCVFSNESLEPYQREGRLPRVAIMTFTNGGAREFRNRLGDLSKSLVWCGTTHGYCFKLLQRFGHLIGYNAGTVGILPEKEKLPRLLAVRDKLNIKMSQAKLLDSTSPLTDPILQGQRMMIWQEYEFLLKRNNLVDFDGILIAGLILLDGLAGQTQEMLDYLFVDEAQDSSPVDWAIYGKIPAANKFYVGDPDQSIYGFRGADPQGLIDLTLPDRHFEVIKLENNYRSDINICLAANSLIKQNKNRVEKSIDPVSTDFGTVRVVNFDGVAEELHAISKKAYEETAAGHSVAVLCRMNFEVKRCRDYLAAEGLEVIKPHREFRPPDWERSLLLLSLAMSPENEILAERYLKLDNEPAIVDRWLVEARAGGKPFTSRVFPAVLEQIGPKNVRMFLAANGVGEVTVQLIRQRQDLLAPDADLMDLLHDLYSHDEADVEPHEGEGIFVGTMHAAKGQEWDCVILPACEQGIIPHLRAVNDAGDKYAQALDEERRLAFVAVTRARHSLYISHCAVRQGPWGPVGTGQPSQFIKEMGL